MRPFILLSYLNDNAEIKVYQFPYLNGTPKVGDCDTSEIKESRLHFRTTVQIMVYNTHRRQNMKKCGIYQILNTTNNKSYIGSSKNISKRWTGHRRLLKTNKHHSIYLQRAYNIDGEYSFKYIILEEVPLTELFTKEAEYIAKLNPEYNLGSIGGGDNISNHPNLAEIKQKHSINGKQRWAALSDEEKSKSSRPRELNPNWRGGKTFFKCPICGKESRIRNTSKTTQLTCKQCRDVSGTKNSFFGKKHSDETKAKLRAMNLGKIPTNAKRILYDNTIFNSCADLARHLGVSQGLITYRIKKGVYTVISPNDILG